MSEMIANYEGETIKLVIVGDGAIGKTSFLISFATNAFPEEYVPTVFDNYETTHIVNNVRYNIDLIDTAGQEDYDEIRQMAYEDINIVVVCYSVDNIHSLNNIPLKWVSEVEVHCGEKFPKVLLGLKSDLESKVDPEKVKTIREKNGFSHREQDNMLVCSAKRGEKLVLAMDFIIDSYLRHKNGEDITKPRFLNVSEEKKEENEMFNSYLNDTADFVISTPKTNIRTSKFFLIESSIPNLRNVDTFKCEADCTYQVDEKTILYFLLCQEDELKKLKNDELFEYYHFFRSLRMHNQLLLILELFLEDDRTSKFFNIYRLFETYCKKYEKKNQVFKSWFTEAEGVENNNKNILSVIEPDTFYSSIGLFLFNRLKEESHEIQTNPEILQTFEKTIFSVIPVLSSYHQQINPLIHEDFHQSPEWSKKLFSFSTDEKKKKISFLKEKKLMRRLRNNNNALNDESISDDVGWTSNIILVSTDGVEFPCHREMLVLRLVYFKRMFEFAGTEKQAIETEKCPKIPIVDMESSVLSALLDFVYLGNIRKGEEEEVELEVLIKLIVNAQKYVAPDLTNHCLDKLQSYHSRFEGKEELENLIKSVSHLLVGNDQVNELIIPRLVSKCPLSFKMDGDDILMMIKKSSSVINTSTSSFLLENNKLEISSQRIEELEEKVERQSLEIEELKKKNKELEEEAMKMKKFLGEKFGF